MISICSSHFTTCWSGTFDLPLAICTFRISRIQLNDPIASRDHDHVNQYAVKPRSRDQKDHLDSSDCGHKQAFSKTVWLTHTI